MAQANPWMLVTSIDDGTSTSHRVIRHGWYFEKKITVPRKTRPSVFIELTALFGTSPRRGGMKTQDYEKSFKRAGP
jgi:hypothetical protein